MDMLKSPPPPISSAVLVFRFLEVDKGGSKTYSLLLAVVRQPIWTYFNLSLSFSLSLTLSLSLSLSLSPRPEPLVSSRGHVSPQGRAGAAVGSLALRGDGAK